MNKISIIYLLTIMWGTFPASSQIKKDTTLSWLDVIDVKLLANPTIVIKASSSNSSGPTSKYIDEAKRQESQINSSQSRISAAEIKLMHADGKNSNEYHQAALEKQNAQWDKSMAEHRKREAEFHNSIIQMLAPKPLTAAEQARIIEAQMQKLAQAKKHYEYGEWDKCLLIYEDFLFGTGVNSNTVNSINPSAIGNDICDFILAARAAMRAADKALPLKTKKNAYEIAFLLTGKSFGHIHESSLDYFEKQYLSMEFINWFIKNVSGIPEKTRTKYNEWFLTSCLENLKIISKASKITYINEYANAIALLHFSFGQQSFYDDIVYPLIHPNDENSKAQKRHKSPGNAYGEETGIKNFGDLNFLLAAYFQEHAGNKPQALEVWLHYLDYADFDWKHKAAALYLALATKKAEELKKELGDNALPHANQNWAITSRDLEMLKQEKAKDEKRKDAGLDWDSEK